MEFVQPLHFYSQIWMADLECDLLTYLFVFKATGAKFGQLIHFGIPIWMTDFVDLDHDLGYDHLTYFLLL